MMTIIWSLLKHNVKPIMAYAIGTSLYLLMLAALYPSMMKTGLLEAKLQAFATGSLKSFSIRQGDRF